MHSFQFNVYQNRNLSKTRKKRTSNFVNKSLFTQMGNIDLTI